MLFIDKSVKILYKQPDMNDVSAFDSPDGQKTRIEERNLLLKDVEPKTIRKAWFTLSHLLLDEVSTIVDMGCGDGAITYAMAVLEPKMRFIGLDKSRREINKAKEKYKIHNLEFKTGDITSAIFEPESLDAIINSYVLHSVYSAARYNETIVSDTLRTHFKMLKKEGVMYIRDYAHPPPEEYVLLELPDTKGKGRDLASMSDAEFLVWYAEHARPRQDAGCGGFFLEELPQRFPKTRLFRVPYKWAYEFIMRKDERSKWEKDLSMEYTFFTPEEFRREIRLLGARAQYSGPYWDENIIEDKFEGKFRLYKDDGTPLGHPPTCYVIVAYKKGERKSLHVHERRPSSTGESRLKISAVRNLKTGAISDIVTRDLNIAEIIPFYVDEDERLKIYLHDGMVRSIVNSVPRGGVSLDDRRWSGHMIEPVAVDISALPGEEDEIDIKTTVRFARDYLGMKPRPEKLLEKGPNYYPSPDYIDERIGTWYLNVEKAKGALKPKSTIGHIDRFQAKGFLRELDAQQVLDAITVGMIPSARLELQILSLYQHLKIRAENWTSKSAKFQIGKLREQGSIKSILNKYEKSTLSYKAVKGTAGDLRSVHSIFVEEGQARGAITGLSHQDVDFVVQDDKTINTAIVIPLTKGLKEDVHANILIEQLPVPERIEGNGTMIGAPTFNLPREITNIRMAKKFIADQFGVQPEMVIKLGESYFNHIGITQQKIHPFAVTVPPGAAKMPNSHCLPFYQLMLLKKSLSKSTHFMILLARAYRYLHEELRLDAKMRVSNILKERFAYNQPDWSIPLDYNTAPGLGEAHIENMILDAGKPQHLSTDVRRKINILNDTSLDSDELHIIDDNLEVLKKEIHKPEDKRKTTVKKTQEKPAPQQDSPKPAPDLLGDFEEELEEFLDTMEKSKDKAKAKINEDKPRPEKW